MIRDGIVDSHLHLWKLSEFRYPWLQDCPLPDFRYGKYDALRHGDFLVDDYRAASRGWTVEYGVAIEAEWDRRDPVGETRWIASVAESEGFPSAFVAHAVLDAPDVEKMLSAHASFPIVRGIRHKPVSAEAARTGRCLMSDRRWMNGYGRLANYGFHFELQTGFEYLNEARDLAATFPEIPIVLNHAGLPVDRSPDGLEAWRRAVGSLAEAPQVEVKISGLGGMNGWWECDSHIWVIRELIRLFGADRCMFGSNYPVDSLCVEYDRMYSCYATAVEGMSEADQRKLFRDNAIRFYRLEHS